jgi:hypothetical protein
MHTRGNTSSTNNIYRSRNSRHEQHGRVTQRRQPAATTDGKMKPRPHKRGPGRFTSGHTPAGFVGCTGAEVSVCADARCGVWHGPSGRCRCTHRCVPCVGASVRACWSARTGQKHTNIHVYVHTATHTHTVSHTRTHTHTHKHTHTHTHTHTHYKKACRARRPAATLATAPSP